ncbi:DNA polymerase delta subunit 3-like isoform X2 [Nylanderia fulva]|uniref:DNA polymerase delta subunit 3-like isoform X2 n=1 Tax=Nylanderia fulva TaxID=613905 RepID=UPI0010FAEAE4|nr:DNA polymerase delta subunit 3-like isoform X2 [Nylanderia fulva]
MEALNEHLEALAGHIFDNDKLVTYKWLSNELHVHVNVAKQILWEFYQKYKNDNIECTYLLIGLLKNNEMRVEVVKESALSKAKEKFDKIISEHLYSVHKPLVDLELLATSGSGNVNYSAIKCDACKERSDEEMQLLRWGTAAKKITIENKMNSKPVNSINSSKTEQNSVTTKKSGFNNLFGTTGKQKSPEKLKSFQEQDKCLTKKGNNFMKDLTEKDETLKEEDEKLTEKEKGSVKKDKGSSKNKGSVEKNKGSVNSTTKKVSPKNNSVQKGSLDNFFGKHASSSKPIEIISAEKKNDNDKKEEIISAEKKNDNNKKKVAEKRKPKEKENLRGKKRNRSKETDETAKKRKRIVVQSDSSDSERQSDIEMEESVPESPEPEAVVRPKSPSPPKIKRENGKRKVLKLVNKTYKEGDYIVTKKEHIYVSCSEDEEETKGEEKRREAKKVETKVEKVKKKQSTLTDFFKKS